MDMTKEDFQGERHWEEFRVSLSSGHKSKVLAFLLQSRTVLKEGM